MDMVERRFWSKVSIGPGCWKWIAGVKGSGSRYGRFFANGKNHPAHRFVMKMVGLPIPDGLQVCHHCDNRSCVRPSHLFLGTQHDNIQDAVAKGRMVCGRRCHPPKLDDASMLEVVRLYGMGQTQRSIAKLFSVSQSAVWRITSGRTRSSATSRVNG